MVKDFVENKVNILGFKDLIKDDLFVSIKIFLFFLTRASFLRHESK